MVDVVRALAVVVRVEVERVEVVAGVATGVAGLGEDRQAAAVVERQDGGIREAGDTSIRPEIVVERAVLLDQDDDVLDVLEARAARGCGERAGDQRVREGRRGAQRGTARQPGAKDLTPGDAAVDAGVVHAPLCSGRGRPSSRPRGSLDPL